nr:MAG TPA: hypothetical protein [Bacteriophage sp.]
MFDKHSFCKIISTFVCGMDMLSNNQVNKI